MSCYLPVGRCATPPSPASDAWTKIRVACFSSLIVAILSLALVFHPWLTGCVSFGFVIVAGLINVVLIQKSWCFFKQRDRLMARKLFLFTLLYLPLMLIACAIFWQRAQGPTP